MYNNSSWILECRVITAWKKNPAFFIPVVFAYVHVHVVHSGLIFRVPIDERRIIPIEGGIFFTWILNAQIWLDVFFGVNACGISCLKQIHIATVLFENKFPLVELVDFCSNTIGTEILKSSLEKRWVEKTEKLLCVRRCEKTDWPLIEKNMRSPDEIANLTWITHPLSFSFSLNA